MGRFRRADAHRLERVRKTIQLTNEEWFSIVGGVQ